MQIFVIYNKDKTFVDVGFSCVVFVLDLDGTRMPIYLSVTIFK